MLCLPAASLTTFALVGAVRVVRETGALGDLDFGVDVVNSFDFDGVTADDRLPRFLQENHS